MMKKIGLLGGMSWESTMHYYRIINETVRDRLGGLHSAECIVYSVEFSPLAHLMSKGSWSEISQILSEAALSLKRAGADFLVICTNTMHLVADEIEGSSSLEILHIAAATAHKIHNQRIKKAALLGTTHTMEGEYYRKPFMNSGIELLVPERRVGENMNRIIFNELCKGVIKSSSKRVLLNAIDRLVQEGAEGVILGCTELPNILTEMDLDVPLFDTTRIHAEAAVDYALS